MRPPMRLPPSPLPWSPTALALVALLGGCREPLCQDFADTYADVALKYRPCGDPVPLPAFDVSHCEQHLGACDDKDRMQLEAQRACYARLDTCQPDQRDAFLQAITDCDALSVSNACEAAIF